MNSLSLFKYWEKYIIELEFECKRIIIPYCIELRIQLNVEVVLQNLILNAHIKQEETD